MPVPIAPVPPSADSSDEWCDEWCDDCKSYTHRKGNPCYVEAKPAKRSFTEEYMESERFWNEHFFNR